jgi:adenine-specific DNA-methyltransferase
MDTLPNTGKIDDFTGTVWWADALDLLRALPDKSVDLIATDPPYFRVKESAWDNAWDNEVDFLAWMKTILTEYKRVLKPNGSLYLFTSPRMAARVEVAIGEYFNVLNRITWNKPAFSTKAEMFDKDTMRGYFPASEAIIFAEQFNSDFNRDASLKRTSYIDAETALKKRLFGDYLQREFDRATVIRKEIAALFPSEAGNLTGCVSNWLIGYNIPTYEQYEKMRLYLNKKANRTDYLRREYEDLRREYEDLRREYEDLRRPFNASDYRPYTDVWTFRTVQAYEGKHECEKPLDMMKHIIETSSRANGIVLDTFAGSGTTLDAARQLGRRFVGCDSDSKWAGYSKQRVEHLFTVSMFGVAL